MGFESNTGLNVHNHYGARDTGGSVGTETRKGTLVVLRVDLTGKSIADAIAGGFVPPVVLPKGAKIEGYRLRVDEAFALDGTSPTVRIGEEDAETTNGVVLTKAELEAVGTKIPASTGVGTWATNSTTGTTVAAKVSFGAMGGTTPDIDATKGKGTLWIEYLDVAKG